MAAIRGMLADLVGKIGVAEPEQQLVADAGGMVQGAWACRADDRVHTYGSCRQARSIGKPIAGFAVVALAPDGTLRAITYGCLPAQFPQSAAAAEAWATAWAV